MFTNKDNQMKFDIAVIGAGSAGAAAAFMLAESGFRVALIEKKSFEHAGANWVNDIPPWMFDRAGLKRPTPPEKHCDTRPFIIYDGFNTPRISCPSRPMWGVDMPRLNQRLLQDGFRSGVAGFDRASITGFDFQSDRPNVLTFQHKTDSGHQTVRLSASLFVDATGITRDVIQKVPNLKRLCPELSADHICSAAQMTFDIKDKAGAQSYLEKLNATPDVFLAWTGVKGPFSTLMTCINADLTTIDILTGVIHDGQHGTGTQVVTRFIDNNPWVGRKISGGSGLIPLRRPLDCFTAAGIAAIGDAACQVFPAHGSGVGNGLIAARLLTEEVSRFDDPGSTEATWAYQSAYQRSLGAVSAAYEIFTRTTQKMSEEQIQDLISGFVTAGSTLSSLNQQLPAQKLADIIKILISSVKRPMLGASLFSSLSRMVPVFLCYRNYPQKASLSRLRQWSIMTAAFGGFEPDIQQWGCCGAD